MRADLGLDAGKQNIETIQVMPQVDLTVDQYDPFIVVKDLPCWPNQPNWEQIKDGAALRDKGVNLEAICTPYDGRTPTTLRRGQDLTSSFLAFRSRLSHLSPASWPRTATSQRGRRCSRR